MFLEFSTRAASFEKGWLKSRRSSAGNCCVEVKAIAEGWVAIRDSKFRQNPLNDPNAEPFIVIPTTLWGALLAAVRSSNIASIEGMIVDVSADGSASIESVSGDVVLAYTAQEWDAFVGGACDGEFDHIGVTVLA